MSLHSVKAFLAEHAPDIHVIELEASTATVALAAEAHGVEPGRITKTLSLRVGDEVVLLVTRGDVRVDNQKFKAQFRAGDEDGARQLGPRRGWHGVVWTSARSTSGRERQQRRSDPRWQRRVRAIQHHRQHGVVAHDAHRVDHPLLAKPRDRKSVV